MATLSTTAITMLKLYRDRHDIPTTVPDPKVAGLVVIESQTTHLLRQTQRNPLVRTLQDLMAETEKPLGQLSKFKNTLALESTYRSQYTTYQADANERLAQQEQLTKRVQDISQALEQRIQEIINQIKNGVPIKREPMADMVQQLSRLRTEADKLEVNQRATLNRLYTFFDELTKVAKAAGVSFELRPDFERRPDLPRSTYE